MPLLTVSSALQEAPGQVRDQAGLLVESEVAGVQDVYFGVWHVPSVRLGLLDLERGVVAAPHDLQGRLVFAEPVLPGGIARDVGAVVVEQIGLDVLLARPAKECELVGPQVRVVVLDVRAGSDVTLPRRAAWGLQDTDRVPRVRSPREPPLSCLPQSAVVRSPCGQE